MRDLIIMRGCPGCGKSTAIEESGLKDYVLSPDDIRLMLRAPEVNEDGEYRISQQDNALVFEMLDTMLVNRMKNGSPTIIDATHCSSGKWHTKQINRYRDLAKEYKYRLFYWEPEREDVEVYVERNKYRDELNRVPENVIRNMYHNWETINLPKDFTKLDTLAFRDDFSNLIKDMTDTYDQVIIVGDVHGCNTVLHELINQYDIKNEKNLYIFVGDYFDRGIENLEVLDTLFDIVKQKNVVLLEGNHELHWVDWAFDRDKDRNDNGMIRFKETTLKQWQTKYTSEKDLKKQLRILYRKMLPAYFFKFLGKEYIVTHAGLGCLPRQNMAAWQYINGHGGYEFEVTQAYESRANYTNYPIQVFGHRGALTSKHSIALEGQVEFGGFLKYLIINKDGYKDYKIKNEVYDKDYLKTENELSKYLKGDYIATLDEEVNAIANSRHIIAKKLPDNLMSLNFNKGTFYHAIWNDLTVKARGLFVDQTTGAVKARSYNKFFNFGERGDEQEEFDNLVYPVHISRKENGFLGIVSWNKEHQKIIFASKSTTQGNFVPMIKDIWDCCLEHNRNLIIDLCKKYNASAVFEVCHPSDNTHMVDYEGKKHLFLLDFIPNQLHLDGINVDIQFSDKLCKEFINSYKPEKNSLMACTLNVKASSRDQLEHYIKSIFMAEPKTEGFVITDATGKMYKQKFPYYLVWKRRRYYLDCIKNNRELPDALTEEDADFINFIKDKDFNTIIEARKAYLERNNHA